jgi:hypothetical protein
MTVRTTELYGNSVLLGRGSERLGKSELNFQDGISEIQRPQNAQILASVSLIFTVLNTVKNQHLELDLLAIDTTQAGKNSIQNKHLPMLGG